MVLDSPGSFESELAALKGVEIIRDLKKAKEVTFALAFVTTQEQINALAPAIARKAGGDAIVWFAYPKGTSKKYKSQIDRDNGWNMLGHEGFEPVRMVAIDEDWSAKRFRRAGFIKNKVAFKLTVPFIRTGARESSSWPGVRSTSRPDTFLQTTSRHLEFLLDTNRQTLHLIGPTEQDGAWGWGLLTPMPARFEALRRCAENGSQGWGPTRETGF